MERKPRKDGTIVKHVDLRVAGTLVRKIPLRLRNISSRYNYRSSSQPQFEYSIDIDEPARVRVSHADPNECCKLAQAELEKELAVDWQPFFHVQVTGAYYASYGFREEPEKQTRQAKLEVEFQEYEIGVRGGEPVYRSVASSGFGHVSTGSPIDEHDNNKGLASALVPATPANRAKLEALVSAVHDLRNRIAEFMRPTVIEKTLADMRVLALPVPAAVATKVTTKVATSKVKPGKVRRK